jgi:hypothetical protein
MRQSRKLVPSVGFGALKGCRTLPEMKAVMIHRLIVPLTLAVLLVRAERAPAQGAFPAPLPGQANPSSPFPPVGGAPTASMGTAPASPFPTTGAAPIAGGGAFGPPPGAMPPSGGPSQACMKNFVPLREEAEKRGRLIKAASDRHAPPDEACKLIGAYGQAELKMIKYVEGNSVKCGIPAQIADQLKAGHKNTEALEKKVCAVAEQVQKRGPAGPSLSEVLGSANSAPEVTTAKKGGSTFDTLNGNVLER